MRRLPALALLLLGGLSCLPTEKGVNPALTGQTMRLTVLHTADIHSRLLPYDLAPLKTDVDLGLSAEAPPYGGVARLAALIRREQLKSDRSMLIDSGDYFQGGPIFNANDGEPEVRWVSLMGYDGVVMGNHEFDKGAHNFADKIQRFGSFPLLAANYWWEENPNTHGLNKLSAPYNIVNVRGIKVAIIGMGSISSMYGLVDGGNSLQATPLEQNETARAYVELLSPVVDMIVILSHLGLTEDQELVTGYDAYYPYEEAKQFLTRSKYPWVQVEPPPAAPGEPPNTFLDGTIRVFIPGVDGIDLVEGGHLHVVLNPPQVVRDGLGRPVIISHSGAFAKYLGRLDLEVEFPGEKPAAAEDSPEMEQWRLRKNLGAEVVAHDYKVFPVDAIWCDDEARSWRTSVFGNELYKALLNQRPPPPTPTPEAFTVRKADCGARFLEALPAGIAEKCIKNWDADVRSYECDRFLPHDCLSRIEQCSTQEDRLTTHLLQPYIIQLDETFALPRIFAFAPREIARRNSSIGGDSPLGNMTAESMRIRRRVEAEFALTNTLGIRDNLYPGPVSLESMFNIFPFENTINIMYLSGAEVQELTDYVAARSADRGCQSQAQVAGVSFVMDCAQELVNEERYACQTAADCAVHGIPDHPDGWQCTEEKVCWAHTSFDVKINGKPLVREGSYKIAVNDYIAKGGSGFKVLKRNTTRIETGISLRDSLIDYLRGQCTCEEILGLTPATSGVPETQRVSAAGYQCARNFDEGRRIIDPVVKTWCSTAQEFQLKYQAWAADKNHPERLENMPALYAGKCNCQEALNGDVQACGFITKELKNFCTYPTRVPIAIGEEDGRIGRRVK